MNGIAPSGVTLREPRAHEAARIAHLFRDAPIPVEAHVIGAVRSRPVERFVAAAAWWKEGGVIQFRLACQPGVPRSPLAGLLIKEVAERARAAGVNTIHYADMLADENEWSAILLENGFNRARSERFFELSAQETWTRIMQIFARHKAHVPPHWRTEAIRQHPPERALEVIGGHHLMPPEELRARWPVDSPIAFEPELSAFLFDGVHCMGVLLGRRIQDAFCVDVLVVRETNPLRRALGNACLLHHAASRSGPNGGPYRWVRFRAGEIEHRITANLALRTKGRELPPRHVFGKQL